MEALNAMMKSDEMWELEAALNTAFLYESFPFFVVVYLYYICSLSLK